MKKPDRKDVQEFKCWGLVVNFKSSTSFTLNFTVLWWFEPFD